MSLCIAGKNINTDEQGFLLDPSDWDECVAEAMADEMGITLDATHWGLINYFRTFYEDHQRHPSMREWVLTLGRHHGKRFDEAKKYRDFLYELFPGGPVTSLCRLAGLPQPHNENEV